MPEFVAANDKLRLTLGQEANSCWVELKDLAGGKAWPRVPLMTLEIHDKAVRYTERITKYRIDRIEELPNGFHVIVGDAGKHVNLGLWLRLEGAELVVTLVTGEVYERAPEMYRVFAIDVMPGLMTVNAGGKLILPVNSGVICEPANKPERTDAFLLYGEQERWELVPTIPVCAAHAADGGLMAIATRCDSDAQCRVHTDGKGSGHVGFAFSLRRHWPDPVDMDNREYRYLAIPAAADPVVFAAKRLRRHVMGTLGKRPLAERAKESPQVAYLLDAYIMKLFYAVENVGYMMTGADKSSPISFRDVMTFDEAGANLKKLHAAGVSKILTESVGWNLRGHDGMYPTRFPVEPRLGGEQKFRELIALGNGLGYHMTVHDNFMMNVKASPEFEPEYLTQDLYGEPLIHGWWAGGIEYASWPLALPDDRVGGHMEKVKALGVQGCYYMDYMAQPLETNYHAKHRGPRSQHVAGMLRILREAKRVFGGAQAEFGFLPVAIELDLAVNCGQAWHMRMCRPEWQITPLLDRVVPIWQLAMHGLIMKEAHGLNWDGAMNCILMGEKPRDEWSARPGVMPVLDDKRIAALKAMFDVAIVKFGYLQTLEMTDYRDEGGIRTTRFEDGTEITADSKAGRLLVNNKEVPRPAGL